MDKQTGARVARPQSQAGGGPGAAASQSDFAPVWQNKEIATEVSSIGDRCRYGADRFLDGEVTPLMKDASISSRTPTVTAGVEFRIVETTLHADTVVLRDPRPGDMGWVVMQHGEIYCREYRFTNKFEAFVADIAARYIRNFDPAWEKGWIAEIDGERVGSVFVMRKSATVAQLRLLILTPDARGHGLGRRLTDECIAFARAKGYRKMTLWTNGHLDAARATYKSRGFKLVKSEPFRAHEQDLVGETWELKL